MAFRSRAELESWLSEYAAAVPGSLRAHVAVQDEEDGSDGGLVVLPLSNATTSVYMQPLTVGAAEWRLTFEARTEPMVVSSTDVRNLAAELDATADLLDFLEEKSRQCLEARTAE